MGDSSEVTELADSEFPDLAIPPGETLAAELRERRLTQTEFARMTGRPVQTINEIINGKKAITAETALQFERALGIPARFWMNLESDYRLAVARRTENSAPAAVSPSARVAEHPAAYEQQ